MKIILTAMLAVLTLSFASASPAQAQMFRSAMSDDVIEQNIPGFRRMGLMPPTGNEVNLDSVAAFAYEMATRDGSLATLPEEFRTEAAYSTKFRTVNGLTDRTMPLDQFRALVNGQGIRLLRPSDFETAAPAPIIAPAPAEVAPVAAPAPARAATPADTARIRGLENRVAAAEAAARQGRVTPAQLAELQALRNELNQAKADIGSLTQAGSALDGRMTAVEGRLDTAVTSEQLNTAIAGKEDAMPFWQKLLVLGGIVLALILGAIGFAAYGRTIRLGNRVTSVETRIEEIGDALPADIRLMPDWQQVIDELAEDEEVGLEILVRGDSGSYEPKFTVLIKKGIGDLIYCQAGIQGHNPDNAISAKNLEQTVRKAGFKNRLTNPIGGLRAAA